MSDVVYLWDGWEPIGRILFVGTFTYAGIILLLRISGKRTLARMTAFDFIITITIGSAFGRILTAKSVSLVEALVTFILLVGLNYIFSVLECRSKIFKNLVTAQPTLVFYNGEFLEKAMRKQRLIKQDLISAARKNQYKNLDQVEAIILEIDGSFSVIQKSADREINTYNEMIS